MLSSKTIETKQEWEEKILNFSEANFLHAWNWGAFHERLGRTVVRESLESNGKTVALVQAVLEPARRGAYLAIPGGPLMDWNDNELAAEMVERLKELAKENKCWFVRFRAQTLDSPELRDQLKSLGCVLSPMHLTADLTLQLDLSLSEEELLAQMRKNHRSTIRKLEKIGLVTSVSTDPNDLLEFHQHHVELSKRHGYVPFPLNFLEAEFETFAEDDQVMLVHARKNDELVASAFVVMYNGETSYHHGVSTDLNREYPGSYAAQWRAILESKERGIKRYNFWGMAPEGDKKHRYAGVRTFKRGFGGQEVMYVPAHDVPVSPGYWFTYAFEQVRKRVRGL